MNLYKIREKNEVGIKEEEFNGKVVMFSYYILNPGQTEESGVFMGLCETSYFDGVIVRRNKEGLRKWFTSDNITSEIKIVPPEEEIIWRLENE